MNKSQRIKITSGNTDADNYIVVKLEQNVDSLEILSLDLSTEDIYGSFNADYGVLVGRVIANGGVGVPNAKISIFIPISDTDKTNGTINSIYPYSSPSDVNKDGKRYNLLPRVGKIDQQTGSVSPKQPFGSFPTKEEVVTNSTFLEVYKNYYKYTTVTNSSGDYMLFGVPTGTQIVHMSCDITDIGRFSMNAASMVKNLGYSPNLFYDNNSKIKPSQDLTDLPNIELQDVGVDIIPFWGDTTNFTIGITRRDFKLKAQLANTFVIFGSAFTDGDNSMWGEDFYTDKRAADELYRIRNDANINVSVSSKRTGTVTETIFYYPNTVDDATIDANIFVNTIDPQKDIMVLDNSEYSSYKRNGDFVFIVNCNRKKIITDEYGNDVIVPNDSTSGVFTEFRGFAVLEITETELPMPFTGRIGADTKLTPFRFKVKIPQSAGYGGSFTENASDLPTKYWAMQNYTFSGGSIYSVAKFYPTVFNNDDNDSNFVSQNNYGFFQSDVVDTPYKHDPFWTTGIIAVGDNANTTGNAEFQFPSNTETDTGWKTFGANWMNFSIYLPQVAFLTGKVWTVSDVRSNTNFTDHVKNDFFYRDNYEMIAAGKYNTVHFARSDIHRTDFILTPKEDLNYILKNMSEKGFILSNKIVSSFHGIYKNGENDIPSGDTGGFYLGYTPPTTNDGGGKINADANESADLNYYFYKGIGASDCVNYLVDLGLI